MPPRSKVRCEVWFEPGIGFPPQEGGSPQNSIGGFSELSLAAGPLLFGLTVHSHLGIIRSELPPVSVEGVWGRDLRYHYLGRLSS